MSRFTAIALFLTLAACGSSYSITETKLNADTCTFTVQFPEDYHGAERGTQVLTVAPLTPREEALERLKRPDYTVGHTLRHRCTGYLAAKASPTSQ